MKFTLFFLSLMVAAGIAVAVSGCGASGPAPMGASGPPIPPNATPAPKLLYVDHNGVFNEYQLPLTHNSKPFRTLVEWPGLGVAPAIAADQHGNVAVASPKELRLFDAPIVSFAASRAKLRLTLTPAITAIGPSGNAGLVDLEYDPNENLWLFNAIGPGITELRAPVTQSSVASISLYSLWRSRLEDGSLHVIDSGTLRHQRNALRLTQILRRYCSKDACSNLVSPTQSRRERSALTWHRPISSTPASGRRMHPVRRRCCSESTAADCTHRSPALRPHPRLPWSASSHSHLIHFRDSFPTPTRTQSSVRLPPIRFATATTRSTRVTVRSTFGIYRCAATRKRRSRSSAWPD